MINSLIYVYLRLFTNSQIRTHKLNAYFLCTIVGVPGFPVNVVRATECIVSIIAAPVSSINAPLVLSVEIGFPR